LLCCSPILRQLRRFLPTFLAATSRAILPIPHTHPPAAGCHSFRKAVGGDVLHPTNMAPLRGSFLAVLASFSASQARVSSPQEESHHPRPSTLRVAMRDGIATLAERQHKRDAGSFF